MINLYKFNRNDIINLIKAQKKTNDGHYWYPNFDDINEMKGNENDDEYYYARELFKHKMYFTVADIEIYLSKKKMKVNIDVKYRKALRFYEINKELKKFKIDDIVPPNEFTVAELIDSYEYIIS